MSKTKPFDISKRVVWEAYERVKANKGAPGVGPEVDPAVCATVVVRAGATAGWHTGRPGSRDSAGSAISPLLANLFLHYAFDVWMRRRFPSVPFERYADDAVVHCRSRAQARYVQDAIAARMVECGLRLHPDKTRIVYCKDDNRRGRHEHVQFDFLGYTFRPRSSKRKTGKLFVNFAPAISDKARKAVGRTIRRWRLHLHNSLTLSELAAFVNPILRGWINYYGRFYRSQLVPVLRRVNDYLARWAIRQYKRLRGHKRRAYRFLKAVAKRQPGLFAHWRIGLTP